MPQLTVRLPDEFVTQLDARGDKATVIRASLDRYFSMLTRARAGLRDTLTTPEISLLADASNGTLYEAWSVPLLVHGIEDAIELDGLDDKWSVDCCALLAKLKALDLASTFALVDSLERFWEAVGRGVDVPYEQILA